jgi:phospholipid-translocating ATPase
MKKFRLITTNKTINFPSNRMCNMKYRWYSIVSWVLINQFEFFFNTYFFAISITQCFEKFAISSPLTSLGPWLLVFFITLFKEGYDDYKRNERDFNINNQMYTVYRNKAFRRIRSKDIQVGDIILLEKDQRVPADMVLLKTADTTGQLFIRTDQLDGETDWKMRAAVSLTQKEYMEEIKDLRILAEEPNKEIYSFSGLLSKEDIDTTDIKLENPSKAGSIFNLFSTKEEEGNIVDDEIISWLYRPQEIKTVDLKIDEINIFEETHAGNELNIFEELEKKEENQSIEADIEIQNILEADEEEMGNKVEDHLSSLTKEGLSLENMLWMNTVVATSSALCCVVYTGNDTRAMINTSKPRNKVGTFDNELNTYSKFLGATSAGVAAFFAYMRGFNNNGPVAFIRFLVLFSSVIPISLKVTIDMARYVYAYYIANDTKILNTIVRNSSLPEELGRISYFLTDKTGTLTKNEMEMKKIHLGTISYTQDLNDEISKNLAKFCSTKDEQGDIFSRNKKNINHRLYELVEGLCVCHNVTPVIDNNTVTYQASSPDEVAIVKWTEHVGMKLFKRDRTSMTILDSLNDEQVYEILYIFPFTSETKRMGIILQKKGTDMCTLFVKGADAVMAKIIQPTDWVDEETENMARDGLRTLVIAKKVLTMEEFNIFKNDYERAKTSLDNRNENIKRIMDSIECDLTVLGLTGVEDKLQDKVKITLENLRNAGMRIWMLTGDKIETAISIATSSKIFDKTTEYKIITSEDIESQLNEVRRLDALVVDGNSLSIIMEKCFDKFIDASMELKAVVGCRFSPTQKALVARALRTRSKKIVCCIGDGGNDVSMITEANIGIGIVGKEGNQASLSADYSIEKFCYVMDLFFWHGRNSYRNSASIAYLVIHRGTILSVLQGLFCALINFIPFNIYHGVVLIAFISCYTFFPIFSVVFSVDVSREVADMFPELYKELVDTPLLSIREFTLWNFMSFYQGTIIMLIVIYSFKKELFSISTLTFSSLIVNEILMVFLTTSRISKHTLMACMLSLTMYLLSFLVFNNIFYINSPLPSFILEVLIANLIAILPKFLTIGFKYFRPSTTSKLESRV